MRTSTVRLGTGGVTYREGRVLFDREGRVLFDREGRVGSLVMAA